MAQRETGSVTMANSQPSPGETAHERIRAEILEAVRARYLFEAQPLPAPAPALMAHLLDAIVLRALHRQPRRVRQSHARRRVAASR